MVCPILFCCIVLVPITLNHSLIVNHYRNIWWNLRLLIIWVSIWTNHGFNYQVNHNNHMYKYHTDYDSY